MREFYKIRYNQPMNCETCAQIDLSLSDRANERKTGITHQTIGYHRRHHLFNQSEKFFKIKNDTEVVKRRRTVRLPDGSYEIIEYKPKSQNDTELSYEDLIPLIDSHVTNPHKQTTQTNHTPTVVFNVADLQIGKAGEIGGGTEGTITRVNSATQKLSAFLKKQDTPPHVIVVDNGDIIENIFNTPQQTATNDLSLTDQIKTARRLMVEILLTLEINARKITYVAVPSNHGEVRKAQKVRAGTTEADFGLDIQEQVRDAINMRPDLARKIDFVRPEHLQTTAEVTTECGTKLAFNHGYHASQAKLGDWWAKIDHGRLPGWDADIMVTAHYHNLGVTQSGNKRWLIMVSSSEPGSGWFTQATGESSVNGVTMFTVLNGMWSDLCIL